MIFDSNIVSLGKGESFTAHYDASKNQINLYKSVYGIIEQGAIKLSKRTVDDKKQLFYGDKCWQVSGGFVVLSGNQFRLEEN